MTASGLATSSTCMVSGALCPYVIAYTDAIATLYPRVWSTRERELFLTNISVCNTVFVLCHQSRVGNVERRAPWSRAHTRSTGGFQSKSEDIESSFLRAESQHDWV